MRRAKTKTDTINNNRRGNCASLSATKACIHFQESNTLFVRLKTALGSVYVTACWTWWTRLIRQKCKERQIITLHWIIITSLLLGVIKSCWRWQMLENMLHTRQTFNQWWSLSFWTDPAVLVPGCAVLQLLADVCFEHPLAQWYITSFVEINSCIWCYKNQCSAPEFNPQPVLFF